MNVPYLKSKVNGSYAVEFAIVGVIFSVLLVFSADVIIKLSYKGKLDRLSYSLVSIIKERKQLYADNYTLSQNDIDSLTSIAVSSLQRSSAAFDEKAFGYVIESAGFGENPTYNINKNQCTVKNKLNDMSAISTVTNRSRYTTLYRVTLCYQTNNLVGNLIGNGFQLVSSNATIMGR